MLKRPLASAEGTSSSQPLPKRVALQFLGTNPVVSSSIASLPPEQSSPAFVNAIADNHDDDVEESEVDLEAEADDNVDDKPGCHRFTLKLSESGPNISWKILLRSQELAELERSQSQEVRDAAHEESQYSEDESVGSYYDTEDSFIDDSEMFDVDEADKIETKREGFFVQLGDVAVREKEVRTSAPKPKPKTKKAKAPVETSKPAIPSKFEKYPEVAGAFSSLKMALEQVGEPLAAIASDAKKPIPACVCTALMTVEDVIRLMKPKDRKVAYEELTQTFGASKNFKDRIKRLYVHWLPTKFEGNMKKVVRRLKRRVKKDVSEFQKAVSENVSSSGAVQVKKTGESKYRCRWDLFSDDLLELGQVATLYAEASNASKKKKAKASEEVALVDVDKLRRDTFKNVLEFWPSECGVTLTHLNDAYKRYKVKRDKDLFAESAGNSAGIDEHRGDETGSPPVSKVHSSPGQSVSGSISKSRPKKSQLPPMSSVFDELPDNPWSDAYFMRVRLGGSLSAASPASENAKRHSEVVISLNDSS